MPLDIRITKYLFSFAGRSAWLDAVFVFGARYLVFLLAGTVFVGLWRALDAASRMQGLFIVGAATLSTYVTTLLLEYLFRRARPYETFSYEPLVRNIAETPSFPSGHATIAFALATSAFLFHQPLGIVCFVLAILVAMSRVFTGVHYLTDVLAGAIVGIGGSLLVYRLL